MNSYLSLTKTASAAEQKSTNMEEIKGDIWTIEINQFYTVFQRATKAPENKGCPLKAGLNLIEVLSKVGTFQVNRSSCEPNPQPEASVTKQTSCNKSTCICDQTKIQ